MRTTDENLLLLERYARTGDAEAFAEIVRRYRDMVYASCLRLLGNPSDAEDVTQECFLRLARKSRSVTKSLGGWLHHCATDLSLNARRERSARRRREENHVAPLNGEPTWEDLAPEVDGALDALPDDLREVLVEHFLRERTQVEIAAELGVSPATISRRVDDAVEHLRRNLKKAGVIVSAVTLAALLSGNCAVAAPATLTAALGKMAAAGAGHSSPSAAVSALAKTKLLLVILLPLLAVVGVASFLMHGERKPAGFAVSGDPIDMKLIGVRPDFGEELYDPSGNPTEPMVLASNYAKWKNDALRRDFILKLPKGHERLLFPMSGAENGAWLSANPEVRVGWAWLGNRGPVVEPEQEVLLLHGDIRKDLAFSYGSGFFKWRTTYPLDRVDLRVRFFGNEPRGEAEFAFTGPFLYSKDYESTSGKPATVRLGYDFVGDHVNVDFSTAERYEESRAVILYDTAGSKHPPWLSGGNSGSNGANIRFRFEGVSLDRIAVITVGETPREKVFHNVQVAYPNRPERTRSPAFDLLEARLGIEADVSKLSFSSWQQALDLIDVLQDYRLEEAVGTLLSGTKPPQLEPEAEQKLRAAANRFMASPDITLRRYGVVIGLWCGWPDVIDPAIDLVLSSDQRARQEAARMLIRTGKILTPEQVTRVKDAALKTDDPQVLRYLFLCLNASPVSGDALWEFVLDDRPWLWWMALADSDKTLAGRNVKDLPLKVMARVGAIYGLDRFGDSAGAIEPLVTDLLPELLTPELATMSGDIFSRVLDKLDKWPDRSAATAAVISFLDQASRQPTPFYTIYRSVTMINTWNGADIGGVGQKTHESMDTVLDWQLVAADAVAWHRTGVDPGSVPVVVEQPKPGDVRVLFLNVTDRARSVWGAWIEPPAGVPHLRHFRVKQGDITFFYCLSHDGLRNEKKLNCRIFVVKDGKVCWNGNVRAGLPESSSTFVIGGEKWECRLEPLDKPSPNLR